MVGGEYLSRMAVCGLLFLSLLVIFSPVLCASPFDLDGDGKVDTRDVAIVARAFGSFEGGPRFDLRADVDGNGRIDMFDIALVARHFGE